MKKILITVMVFLLLLLCPWITLIGKPISDYIETYQMYFIEPIFTEALNIVSEDIVIQQLSPSSRLSLVYQEKPKLEYNSLLTLINEGAGKNVKIIVPYYNYYDSNIYSKISLKVNNLKQNPLVAFSKQSEQSLAFLNYNNSYNSRYDIENINNNFVGYFYQFSRKEEVDQPYVEFIHSLLSSRLFVSDYLERLEMLNYDTYHFGYLGDNTSILSMDRKLSFVNEINVSYTEEPLFLNDFFDFLFKKNPYYDKAKALVAIELDSFGQNDYQYFQEIIQNIDSNRYLTYYSYEIFLPAGLSEISINYTYPYTINTSNTNRIKANIITKSNEYKTQVSLYKVSYILDEPFFHFSSDSLKLEEDRTYSYTDTQIPFYNLGLEVLTQKVENFEPTNDDNLLLSSLTMLVLPIAIFVGIIIPVIILMVRKKKIVK